MSRERKYMSILSSLNCLKVAFFSTIALLSFFNNTLCASNEEIIEKSELKSCPPKLEPVSSREDFIHDERHRKFWLSNVYYEFKQGMDYYQYSYFIDYLHNFPDDNQYDWRFQTAGKIIIEQNTDAPVVPIVFFTLKNLSTEKNLNTCINFARFCINYNQLRDEKDAWELLNEIKQLSDLDDFKARVELIRFYLDFNMNFSKTNEIFKFFRKLPSNNELFECLGYVEKLSDSYLSFNWWDSNSSLKTNGFIQDAKMIFHHVREIPIKIRKKAVNSAIMLNNFIRWSDLHSFFEGMSKFPQDKTVGKRVNFIKKMIVEINSNDNYIVKHSCNREDFLNIFEKVRKIPSDKNLKNRLQIILMLGNRENRIWYYQIPALISLVSSIPAESLNDFLNITKRLQQDKSIFPDDSLFVNLLILSQIPKPEKFLDTWKQEKSQIPIPLTNEQNVLVFHLSATGQSIPAHIKFFKIQCGDYIPFSPDFIFCELMFRKFMFPTKLFLKFSKKENLSWNIVDWRKVLTHNSELQKHFSQKLDSKNLWEAMLCAAFLEDIVSKESFLGKKIVSLSMKKWDDI